MSCTIEQAVENRLVKSLKLEHNLKIRQKSLNNYVIEYTGNEVLLNNLIDKANEFVGGDIASISRDGRTNSFNLNVDVSERLANVYLSKSNGTILEDGSILSKKQLAARRNLTPRKLFDQLKKTSALDQKKRLVTTDLGQLGLGRIYITAGNQRQAQILAEKLRYEYGLTFDQLRVEAYDKSLMSKKTLSEEAFRFKNPTQIGWRFKLGLNPNDNTQFKKSSLEAKAESRILENREADYIIPSMASAMANEEDLEGFNYGNHIENKKILISQLEEFVNTQQNKGNKSTLEHTRIQSIKRLITKLKKSVKFYQGTATSLQNYFDTFNQDIESISKILDRGLVEDLIVVEKYLEMLKEVSSTGPTGFLQQSLAEMLSDPDISPENKNIIEKNIDRFNSNLQRTEERYKAKKDLAIKNLLVDYIKNTQGHDVDLADVEQVYVEKIDGVFKDLNVFDLALNSIENSVENKNLLGSVAHEILARAVAKNQETDLRQNLYQIKSSIESKLKQDGHTAKSSFFGRLFTKSSYDIFFRVDNSDDFNMRLASIFSSKWFDYKKTISKIFESIEQLEFAPNKKASDYTTINNKRNGLHASITTKGHILEVFKTPEFRSDPDIAPFVADVPIDDKYKSELISKIGQIEYDKLVAEQKEHLYSFIAFQRNLVEEYLTRNNVDNIKDLPTEEYNNFQRVIAVNSPFMNNINSNNKATAVFRNEEGNDSKFFIPSSLKFISYTANLDFQKGTYKDEEFVNTIQNDPSYFEAWKLFDESLQYINTNNNKTARDTVHNQITAQSNMIRKFLVSDQSFLSLISKRSIDWIAGLVDTSLKEDTEQKLNISSRVSTVNNVVNSGVKSKLQIISTVLGVNANDPLTENPATIPFLAGKLKINKEFLESSEIKTIQDAILANERHITLNSQDLDFVETLASQIEMIEAHKAKKESEATLEFILNKLKAQKATKKKDARSNAVELLQFFIEKKVYDVNNMANFGHMKLLFKSEDRPMMKEAQKAVDILQNQVEDIESTIEMDGEVDPVIEESLKELQKEIKALETFIKTNAREITVGSILESSLLRVARFTAFFGNFGTQLGNYAMGNVSALEMDGKLWKSGNIYKAKSHTRKWKTPLLKLSPKQREIREKRDLLINRLKVFQNSANDIFNVRESRIKSTVGKVAMNGMQLPGEVEKTIQRPQVLAMLGDENLVYILDKNGNKHPAYDFDSADPLRAFKLDGDKLILHPDFDTAENRATWLDNTSDQYADFFGDAGIVPNGISVTNGNYRDLSVYLAEKRMLTAMLFMFKRWFAETLNKKFAAYDALYKNKHGVEASSISLQTAILQGLNVGSLIGGPVMPIAAATLLGARALSQTKAMNAAEIDQNKSTVRYLTERVFKTLLSRRFYTSSARVIAASNVKAVQISINSLFGTNVIDNEFINKVAGYNNLDGTEEEIIQSKQELQYLMSTLALTIIMTGARILTHALMYPDDEEEKAFNKSVREGDTFWERFQKQPDIMAYMLFENQSQKILRDINLFSSIEGFMDVAMPLQESRSVMNWVAFLSSPDLQSKEGNFKTGKNSGKNRIGVAATKLFVPGVFDEYSFGFASSARKDWTKKDLLDNIFTPAEKEKTTFKKMESNWKLQRAEEKEKLNKQYKGIIPNDEKRKAEILKMVNKSHPSIKKHFDEKGDIKVGAEVILQKYK